MSSEQTDTRTRILETTWQLLEQQQGQGVKMSDIARDVGISRQAVYLHFPTRTELLIATMDYVDEVKGLDKQLAQLQGAENGTDMLGALVKTWGNYIPEIYGMAKAMLQSKDSDEAMAAAWDNGMQCLLDICQQTVKRIKRDGQLHPDWSAAKATEFLWTLLSVANWEHLTKDCGWSQKAYVQHMQQATKQLLTT